MKRRYNSLSVKSCRDVSSRQIRICSNEVDVDQLHTFTVQQQNDILAKCLVHATVGREYFDHPVG